MLNGAITTRMSPKTNNHQHIDFSQIIINPLAAKNVTQADSFGNTLFLYTLNKKLNTLCIAANHIVTTFERKKIDYTNSTHWEDVAKKVRNMPELLVFLSESDYISINSIFHDYAKKLFEKNAPLLIATESLIEQIYNDFTYAPSATTSSTLALTAFQLRRGVCQDFSHIAICCLRSLGIAARYVSGYIDTTTNNQKLYPTANDASHAWISVYEPLQGWIDFDPTNNKVVDESYIEIGYGRDYSDLSPLTGHTDSAGKHQLKVLVDVKRLT